MQRIIEGDNISEVWYWLLNLLIRDGLDATPRGLPTKEILNMTLTIKNGLNNIIAIPKRDINYRFMVAEWLWILGGIEEVAYLSKYNSFMKTYSDDGIILRGAYGPRLNPQMPYVVKALEERDSRQAVATIWSPSPTTSKDIPCTIALQWFLRDDLLHTTITMRSSDAWKGIPYDYFSFSQITNCLASVIDVEVGSITMNLGSSHLYQEDYKLANEVIVEAKTDYLRSISLPTGIMIPDTELMKKILNVEHVELPGPWAAYEACLIKNKATALEVLRVMSEAK